MTFGFEVFVQEVIAAITTEPWLRLAASARKLPGEALTTSGEGRLLIISVSVQMLVFLTLMSP